MKKVLALAGIFILLITGASFAYEVTDVKGGGSIKGKVKAATKISDPELRIDKDVDFCGKTQKANMYMLSADLGVKNALVIVEGVQKGKAAPKSEFLLDNNKCYFEPVVGIAYVGGSYAMKNSDSVLHNTNMGLMTMYKGKERKKVIYNLAFPTKGMVIKKPVEVAGMHEVKCDAHPWMRAYIYASEHPYVAVTDANGNFEIKDLLPGKYTVKFWHEGLQETTQTVEVKANAAADVNVTLNKKK
ncbi:MAG: carboxypeptidase regulatory-like domain-containing protein [Nitrospirae bacterium]|nr:carboxypeptidase regulatory-like domain-containing protein [Nitrospirota bacterium]